MTQTPETYQSPDTIGPKPGTDSDETANVALLPCPHCGPGESIVEPWHDDVAKRWRVGCGRCGCSTGISPRDKTKAPAIAAWNRRAAPTLPADVKGLVEVALNAPLPGGAQVWHLIDGGGQQPSDMARTVMRAALSAAFTHLRKEQQS